MDDAAFNTESVAADQLKAFIERIERLEEEKAGIAGDIKDVYAEAKGNGFDTKVLRKIIAIRKRDYAERQEEEAILELYMQALGMSGWPKPLRREILAQHPRVAPALGRPRFLECPRIVKASPASTDRGPFSIAGPAQRRRDTLILMEYGPPQFPVFVMHPPKLPETLASMR